MNLPEFTAALVAAGALITAIVALVRELRYARRDVTEAIDRHSEATQMSTLQRELEDKDPPP